MSRTCSVAADTTTINLSTYLFSDRPDEDVHVDKYDWPAGKLVTIQIILGKAEVWVLKGDLCKGR